MTKGYDEGILDQAAADIPALCRLEDMARDQYERAEGLLEELGDSQQSRFRFMLIILVLIFIIVGLAGCLVAKSLLA